MKTFALDASGDIYIDGHGNLATLTGALAVGQNCVTAISAQRAEMIYAVNQGMPTTELAWNKLDSVGFEAAARTIIINVDGVIEVRSFTVTTLGDVLNYQATILTVYGETQINGSV